MTLDFRINRVKFADEKLFQEYQRLKNGKSEERLLALEIDGIILGLRENPFKGVAIPKRLWPREYVRKYGIGSLRKCDLPKGWRLLYSVTATEKELISVLLEWFDHKNYYEKRFKYKVG